MIELHGWITFRETYKSDLEEDNIDTIMNKISQEIDKMLWFKPQTKVQNGQKFVQFTIFANRKNLEIEEAFTLFGKVGELAEGSYGLIYLYDDEEEKKENQFQVFTLSRGKVKQFDDFYLSPIVPIIEDEM